jgi:hypothetical protein
MPQKVTNLFFNPIPAKGEIIKRSNVKPAAPLTGLTYRNTISIIQAERSTLFNEK